MRTIYNWLIGLVIASMLISCETKQDVWDTGICSPYHDCSIMEYLRGDNYNWELTVELIEHAGLTDLFEGQVDTLPEITFWGFQRYSVLRYLYDNKLERVSENDVDEAKKLVLMHVTKGKVLKKDITVRDENYYIYESEQTGGTDFYTLEGSHLRAYVDIADYVYVPDGGAVTMYLYSFTAERMVPLSSPDIQPLNGVVHALNYNYVLGKI